MKCILVSHLSRCPRNHKVSDRQAGSKARPSDAKAKRKEKKPKQHSTNTDEVEPSNGEAASNKIGQSEEDLKARILELELENAKLRTAAVQPVAEKASGAINGATCGHAAQTQSTAEGVENEEILDMSAWEGYGLDPLVVKALAAKRFTSPTPIQHECLPAAVLGGSEIIGAAQTVRFWLLHKD
jgi:ATP-dependent RNA helicase DDX24/MAK5